MKLTTAMATKMVERIEALQAQIGDVYAEAVSLGGANGSNVIREAVKERAAMREAEFVASATLASLDATDED